MKKKPFIKAALFMCLGLFVTATAFAGSYAERCLQGKIPSSFIEACNGKIEGAKVHVQTSRGENLQAICVKDDNTLRAVPERFYKQYGAMVSACTGKTAGDRVRVASPQGGTLNAVCENWADELWANPEKGEGLRQVYRREMLDACQGKAKGDIVEYTTPCGATFEGVCVAEGKELIAQPYGEKKYDGEKSKEVEYGSLREVCKGKKKGEKASFMAPSGARVNVVCGDTLPRMDSGKRGGRSRAGGGQPQ